MNSSNEKMSTVLIIVFLLLLVTSVLLNIFQWLQPRRLDSTSTPTLPVPQPTGAVMTETSVPTISMAPMPTVSQVSICPRTSSSCQTVEFRARDLLRATYNTHRILNEIRNGQVKQQNGVLNRINNLNNELVDLWMNIAGYGLGTDPYVDIHIMVGNSAFKDATTAPSYGLENTHAIGMPRLFNTYIENSNLPPQTIQTKEVAFVQLVQAYANPAVYPHPDFFDRAYTYYRNGKLLNTQQYQDDLTTLNIWLTNLENVLLAVPTFLHP